MDMQQHRRDVLREGTVKAIDNLFSSITNQSSSSIRRMTREEIKSALDKIVAKCNNIYELLEELEQLDNCMDVVLDCPD